MLDFDRFEALTFDCYGTLVDWEGGIHGAFARFAAGAGLAEPEREHVLRLHARIEPGADQVGPGLIGNDDDLGPKLFYQGHERFD